MDVKVARSRLEADRGRLLQTQDAMDQAHLSEATEAVSFGEPSPIDRHPAEAGSDMFEREKEFAILDLVAADLQALRDAFRRLELGTYGQCETCGGAIPDSRLAAVPATRFCVEHEWLWERRSMSFPEGPFSDAAPSAERLAEREAIHDLEFLPDEDELDEIRDRDLGAEEAALHHTEGEPASELDPGELELAESMQWEQAAAERTEAELEERDLRHQAETVASEEAELGD